MEQPVENIPAKSTQKSNVSVVLATVLLLVVVFIGGIYLGRNIEKQEGVADVMISPTSVMIPSPTQELFPSDHPSVQQPNTKCVAGDESCILAQEYIGYVSNKDIDAIVANQNKVTITCDSEGFYAEICGDAKTGDTRSGYSIGYYQSEGTVQNEEDHKAKLASMLNKNYAYYGVQSEGNKMIIVFVSNDGSFIALPLIKSNMWRISYILTGKRDDAISSMDKSILEYVR